MNIITLSISRGSWVATYSGPHAEPIKRLFGSATIPTAFTSQASIETVSREIKRLNPGTVIARAKVSFSEIASILESNFMENN